MRAAAAMLGQAVGRLIRKAALLIEIEAIQVVPKAKDNLMASITTWFEGEGSATRGVVKAGAPYAAWVHNGTGIYGPIGKPIVPRRAKALYFPVGTGEMIWRKSVKGMKPRPFFKWAVEKALPRIAELARAAWEEAFSALGGS